MSGAKRTLPLLAALCFALFLLYGIYFNAFGANAESMMAFFGITESRQGFVMTIQSLGGIVMTVLLGLFGERLHKLYGLLAGAVLVGVAGVTIGTMPLYGNDSYGLLLVFALIGGVGYITIDLLMNGVIADVFPEKKSTLLPIVHGFYGLGAMLAPLLVTWLTDSGRPATFAVPYLVLGAAAVVAALLLVLWYHLGFNRIDSPLDLTLAIVWWAGIVAIAAILVRFEERRRRQIRTLYVSPKSLYSSELGMVGIGEAGAVEAMRGMLGQLKYGFDSKGLPDRKKFDYRFVVRTDEFKEHDSEDDKPADDAAAALAAQRKDPTWKGAVIKIDRQNGNTETPFDGIEQLEAALA